MNPKLSRFLTSLTFWVGGTFLHWSLYRSSVSVAVPFFLIWAIIVPYAWVYFDAKARGLKLGVVRGFGVLLLSWLFIPAYIVQTRPPNRNLLSFAKFLGLFVLSYYGVALSLDWLVSE